MENGYLKLIIGPMFAGKTTALIAAAKDAKVSGKASMRISHVINVRDMDIEGKIEFKSHNDEVLGDVFACEKLKNVFGMKGYAEASHIFIEELQFFEDAFESVVLMVERDGKNVTAAGLDGSYMRTGFGRMLELIPFCDEVVKLVAKCSTDGCDRDAPFTKKTTGELDGDVVDVGGADKYSAVCRKHYLWCLI